MGEMTTRKPHWVRTNEITVVHNFIFSFENSRSLLYVKLDAGVYNFKKGIDFLGLILDFKKETMSENDKEEFQKYSVHTYNISEKFSRIEVSNGCKYQEYTYSDIARLNLGKVEIEYLEEIRAETETLIGYIFGHFFYLRNTINEPMIQEFIEGVSVNNKEENLVTYLSDVSNIYNYYVSKLDPDLEPSERVKIIIENEQFQKEIAYLSRNFELELDLSKATLKKSNKEEIEQTFDTLKEIVECVGSIIEAREQYESIPNRYVSRLTKMSHHTRLESEREKFKGIINLEQELEEYQSGVLKQTATKEKLEEKVSEIKTRLDELIDSLYGMESRWNIYSALGAETDDANYKGGMTSVGYSHRLELRNVPNAIDEVSRKLDKISIKKIVKSMVYETEMDIAVCEKIYPEYKTNCLSLIECTINKMKNMKFDNVIDKEYVQNFLDINIRMLSVQKSIMFILFSNQTTSKLDKNEYFVMESYLKNLTECSKNLKGFSELTDEQKVSRMKEFISDSDETYKMALYSRWKDEIPNAWKDRIHNKEKMLTDQEGATVLTNAFKKSLSGESFFSKLTNSIPALPPRLEQNIVMEYHIFKSQEKIQHTVHQIIKLLEEIITKFADNISTAEPRQPKDELLDSMVKELEEKGLSHEDALNIVGKMAEKVVDSKEVGYYSNDDTENTESSRFNAMNRR